MVREIPKIIIYIDDKKRFRNVRYIIINYLWAFNFIKLFIRKVIRRYDTEIIFIN